jgi:hypothetical protein
VAVAAGNSFSLLLTRDGTVWSAGINTLGQLGHGSIDSQESVAPVAGLASGGISSGVAIAAGSNHALALKSDGTVWAWGANDSGQLGNGCTIGSNCSTSSTPVQVSGLTNVVAIAAGGSHSLALKSDGTVWAWGLNSNGQLGNNSTTSSSTPVQVTGLPFITQIAAGQLDSQAIDRSGDLYGWGANGNGQLGVGNTNDQLVATFVTSIHNGAELLAPGSQADHTLFIGEPYLKVTSANPVIFPSETPGTPSPSQSVTVLNNGVVPVAIAQAAIVGSDGDEFSFAGDGCSGTTVQPFKTCTISIRYDPKINAKAVATLTIPSNGANPPVAVTLDPPAVAAAPTSHAPAVKWVVCGHSRVRRGHLVVRCRLRGSGAGVARRDSRRLTARLTRGGRLLARGSGRASSTGAATITLRLPRRLRAGSYRLTVTATGAAAAWRSLRL